MKRWVEEDSTRGTTTPFERVGLLILAAIGALLLTTACNRAGARIPYASGAFHPAKTGYVASKKSSRTIRVSEPVDDRPAHYGEKIAGTKWKACSTDPFPTTTAAGILSGELERELIRSEIFAAVNPPEDPEVLVLETQIRAMCAQAIGFIYGRVAGITSFHFTLKDGDRVLFDRTIERVVTDADPEYTGKSVGFIEQVMKVTISDSLREVQRELLPALEQAVNE